MTNKTITADEARKNTKLKKYDEEQILCDLYKSIKNSSNIGRTLIVHQYPKSSIINIGFCSIVADIKEKGFNVKFVDTNDPVHIEVSW